jgi:hypothetical protein
VGPGTGFDAVEDRDILAPAGNRTQADIYSSLRFKLCCVLEVKLNRPM